MDLLHDVRIFGSRLFHFVTMHAFDGQTDREISAARPYVFAVAR